MVHGNMPVMAAAIWWDACSNEKLIVGGLHSNLSMYMSDVCVAVRRLVWECHWYKILNWICTIYKVILIYKVIFIYIIMQLLFQVWGLQNIETILELKYGTSWAKNSRQKLMRWHFWCGIRGPLIFLIAKFYQHILGSLSVPLQVYQLAQLNEIIARVNTK